MNVCSSCYRKLPPDAFTYENKTYKTCVNCKTSRAEKKGSKKNALVDNTDGEESPVEILSIDEINSYVADTISGLERDVALFLTFRVKLNEATLTTVGTDVRVMAKLIIDEIEEGDDYKWM